jgi:lipopolysaccharide biosynthesis glycosyltransferase
MASNDFVPGILCLIKSLKKVSKYPIFVISLDLSTENIDKIQSLGGICQEFPIIGSKQAITRPWHSNPEFANNCFNKLHLWNTEFEKVVYLDSDCLVLKNIDELFYTSAELSAVPSYQLVVNHFGQTIRGFYTDRFQAGVLAITPNKEKYNDLMNLKDTLACPADPSDQGFLNEYFKNKWHKLSPIYNATRRVFMSAKDIWNEMSENIRVIHFTLEEPWKKSVPGCESIEKIWWEHYNS